VLLTAFELKQKKLTYKLTIFSQLNKLYANLKINIESD
jgi:hypothetical protein